jgi:hypothetical protein
MSATMRFASRARRFAAGEWSIGAASRAVAAAALAWAMLGPDVMLDRTTTEEWRKS